MDAPQKFSKKPVVIEAVHYTTRESATVIAGWCGGSLVLDRESFEYGKIRIPTLVAS